MGYYRRCLGNGARWKEIYDLNADVIGVYRTQSWTWQLQHRALDFSGTVLNIP